MGCADHHGAFQGLSQATRRQGQKRIESFGHKHLSPLRPQRDIEIDLSGERLSTKPRSYEQARCTDSLMSECDGETIVASSSAVAEPVFIRYGWANSPQCNLFNGEGLPASPFTSVHE